MIVRVIPTRPFLDHEVLYFLCTWEGVDWEGNTCDKIHDYKRCVNVDWGVWWGAVCTQCGIQNKRTLNTVTITTLTIFSPSFTFPTTHLRGDSVSTTLKRVTCVWWGLCDDQTMWIRLFMVDTRSEPIVIGFGTNPSYDLLIILPTCLIVFASAIHNVFLILIIVLCRLDGQMICVHELE